MGKATMDHSEIHPSGLGFRTPAADAWLARNSAATDWALYDEHHCSLDCSYVIRVQNTQVSFYLLPFFIVKGPSKTSVDNGQQPRVPAWATKSQCSQGRDASVRHTHAHATGMAWNRDKNIRTT